MSEMLDVVSPLLLKLSVVDTFAATTSQQKTLTQGESIPIQTKEEDMEEWFSSKAK